MVRNHTNPAHSSTRIEFEAFALRPWFAGGGPLTGCDPGMVETGSLGRDALSLTGVDNAQPNCKTRCRMDG